MSSVTINPFTGLFDLIGTGGGPGSITITGNDNDPQTSNSFTIVGAGGTTFNWDGTKFVITAVGGSVTLTGDSGTASGNDITLFSNRADLNSGSSVSFDGDDSSTFTFNLTDSSNNTLIGKNSGNLTVSGSGSQNTGLGFSSLAEITSGLSNVSIGAFSMLSATTAESNVAAGLSAGEFLIDGRLNIYIGDHAGRANNADESNNIYINSVGVASESHCLRLGNATGSGNQELLTTFISGINGNTLGNPFMVTIDPMTDQLGSQALPGSGIETVDGDVSFATGPTISILAGVSSQNCGSSVEFVGNGTTTIQLNVTDTNHNTILGMGAGKDGITGILNTGYGHLALSSLTTSNSNSALGNSALSSLTSGEGSQVAVGVGSLSSLTSGGLNGNTALGPESGANLLTGVSNLYLGYQAGFGNNGAEGSNIYLSHPGNSGESNCLRIGLATGTSQQQLSTAFISGINSNNAGDRLVVINSSTDQLGWAFLPPPSIETIDGDSGSISGSAVTIYADNAANNSGSTVLFKNSGTTSLLSVTDVNFNTMIGQLAGNSSLTGADSTGLGYSALAANISGTGCTAVGMQSLTAMTLGVGNTSIGFRTLINYTGFADDGQNTALGLSAGSNLLTGLYNTYLGAGSGVGNSGAESSNIYINNIGVGSESNCIRLGAATGTGAAELSTAFISGIFGNAVSNAVMVTLNTSTDQLGTLPLPTPAPSTTYVNSSPYPVLVTDDIILCDTNLFASPMSVVLIAAATPPPQDGQVWTIKDWSGAAATFNITVTVSGGTNIDGSTSFVLNENYQSVSICWSALEATYSVVYDYAIGSAGSVSIAGDSGSISGGSLQIFANTAAKNSGSSVSFVNSGTISTLNLTDSNDNTLLGNDVGGSAVTGTGNAGVGQQCLSALTSGSSNLGFGQLCLDVLTSGNDNVGIGYGALHALISGGANLALGFTSGVNITGSFNTVLGNQCGANIRAGTYNSYVGHQSGVNGTGTDSHNIYINNFGNASGESNTLRLGAATGTGQQQLSKSFISGINGNTVSSALMVTIDSSTDQLGVQAIPAGGGLTWSDEATTFPASSGNGYFITAGLIVQLPASPSNGDQIDVYVQTGVPASVVVLANTGHTIQLGANVSSSAGTATNNSTGDCLQLIFRSTNTQWCAIGSQGSWVLA